jgi:outer membrane PBP1 activator LpoA protein
MPTRPLARLSCAALVALAVSGCPSLQRGLPPSVDRAESLEHSGDTVGAARVYEDLAEENTGSERNDFLLRAARDYLSAQHVDDASRVLSLAEPPFSAAQQVDLALSRAELALDRGQTQEAQRQLNAMAVPREAQQAARYQQLKARLAGRPVAPSHEAEKPLLPGGGGPQIALLLPVTGRAASAAISVRDGFMTGYYQAAPAERPRLRVYDTGVQSVAEALTQASHDGADFIVGPLTREEVIAAAQFSASRPPILALNFLPTEQPAPARFWEDALSPEDEARLAARRVLEDHHRRGVALVPSGEWGTRVLNAFRQELQAGGGELLAVGQIDTSHTDWAAPITEVLRISDSTARWHRLESVLGTKLQFEPRRRGDIEFIFAPAQANIERLLRPQLRFHYAGDIATYATSDAFEPDVRANDDLDGLIFPDMPWMLGGDLADAVRAATRDAWPTGGPYRGRLFAFGFDAFRLAQALRHAPVTGQISVDGLTGRLSLDNEHRVRRELVWAQLYQGGVRLLPAAAQ